MTHYDEDQKDEIRALLVGHKVTKVADDRLLLDDGRVLRFEGHEGGCSCGAGDYDLTRLNGVDNVITDVHFIDDPAGDDLPDRASGTYRIYVYAAAEWINLATFEGSDGNGYYGTGYSIQVGA